MFAKPPRCKHATHTSKVSSGTTSPTLSLRNSLETLLVEPMEKSVNDESYKSSVSGSQSDGDSDNSSTDLKLIFNNEV